MQEQSRHQFYADHLSAYESVPTLATVLLHVSLLLAKWKQASETRKVLKALTDEELRDIGVSYQAAQNEARRPFYDV